MTTYREFKQHFKLTVTEACHSALAESGFVGVTPMLVVDDGSQEYMQTCRQLASVQGFEKLRYCKQIGETVLPLNPMHMGVLIPVTFVDDTAPGLRAMYSSKGIREAENAFIMMVDGMPPMIGDWEPEEAELDPAYAYLLGLTS